MIKAVCLYILFLIVVILFRHQRRIPHNYALRLLKLNVLSIIDDFLTTDSVKHLGLVAFGHSHCGHIAGGLGVLRV